MISYRLIPWLGRFFLPLAALAIGGFSSPAHSQDRLIVFAAASTTEAVLETTAAFVAVHPGVEVVTSFASSSTLARQIENGAPANIFLSANPDWMDYLEDGGHVATGLRVELLQNRIVLIAPADSNLDIPITPGFVLAEVLAGGRLAMGDPDHVPAGIYGKAALQTLGVWNEVAPLTARTADVRAVLALVERSEAVAGIVYATDAAITSRVRIVGTFPESSHPPIIYPVVIVRGGDSASARAFLAFLRSDTAALVFRQFGFIPMMP